MTAIVMLGDVLDFHIGGGWGSDEPTEEETTVASVIRGTDIPLVSVGDVSTVPRRFHKPTQLEKRALHEGDLIIESSGGSKGQPVGRSLLVTDRLLAAFGGEPVICASFCKLARVNPDLANPGYVYRQLQLAYVDGRLDTFQVQSTGITNLRWKPLLSGLEIALPSASDQARIAGVFDVIDDLIENNRRRVEVLEEMARTIYRDWFVHFRYPGHDDVPLVDSDLGPIPSGWQAAELFDVADVTFGFPYKSKRFSDAGPFPVIRIRDVRDGATATFTDEQADKKYKVLDGDVLIGMDGDFHMAQWTGGRAWLNQRVTRLRPMGGMSARHLLLAVERPIQAWNRAISGTTVAHLGKKHLVRVRIAVPPPPLLEKATDVFASIEGEILRLTQSADRLAELRDLLLPRLVTGRIDVSELDLDALVDDVLRGTGTGTGVGNDPTAKPGTTGSASADAREPVTAEVG